MTFVHKQLIEQVCCSQKLQVSQFGELVITSPHSKPYTRKDALSDAYFKRPTRIDAEMKQGRTLRYRA